MGLFDTLKKVAGGSSKASGPASVQVSADEDELSAPVRGRAIALAEVPDPVFAGGMLGDGCAIWPEDDLIYSPVTGEVTVTMGHALGLKGDNGTEALVHVGIDTVAMQGEGFEGLVAKGDRVTAGQPVLRVDRAKIKAAGHPDCVVLVVSNTADYASVGMVVEPGATVEAGQPVLRVQR